MNETTTSDNNSISRFSHVLSRVKAYSNWYNLVWPLNRFGGANKIILIRNGPRVYVRSIFGPDFVVVHEMFSRDDYHVGNLSLSAEQPVILDIGANIGAFSLFVSSHFKNAKIFAYEPAETNFAILKKNIELNNLSQRVFPYELAISTKEGEQQMTYSKDEYAHSLVAEQVSADFEKTGIVQCTTLAKIFEDNHIDMVDILKMDIEGLEYEVLYGLPKDLFKKIKYIALEIHDHHTYSAKELIDYLTTQGFAVERVPTHPRVYLAANKDLI